MRYLHTMIRVGDLERSIRFYTEVLGLKVHDRREYPEGKFTLVFLGQGPGTEPFLELTHNWETQSYDLGKGYGHMAFGVPDIYAACEKLTQAGAAITRPPGPMKHGKSIIAFLKDPDGYAVELIQR
jgi:lactoylglutathione lyase